MPQLSAVVLASDFHPRFLNFYPIVEHFWLKHFGVSPTLAVVYKGHQSALVDKFMQKHKDLVGIVWLEGHPEATLGNQAKLARWYLASQVESEWTTIDDLDTIHVRADYLMSKFSQVPPGKMLGIGLEVYLGERFEGAFPMGNFSGSQSDFQSLFDLQQTNPSFIEFVERFRSRTNYRTNPFAGVKGFSDEELLRDIRSEKSFDDRIHFAKRDLDIKSDWLDRSWWPSIKEISKRASTYESVNFPRPYYHHRRRINAALRAIDSQWKERDALIPVGDTIWNIHDRATRLIRKRR